VKAWELFDLINPVRHGSGESALTTYKVEPYVLAADVYGVSPHEGRGGWTWYTGSAGWMYRLLLESLLGIRVENGRLRLRPVLRPGWDAVEVRLRHGASLFRIAIRTDDVARAHLTVDGLAVVGDPALVDDGAEHRVELVLPAAAQGAAGSGTD
jgi:cyclic beta-1,2-glucan synthetase